MAAATETQVAAQLPKREIHAKKIHELIVARGLRARLIFGTIQVRGPARKLEISCDDASIGIFHDTRALCEYESLPSGMTYAQIADHIVNLAQNWEVKKIGAFERHVR